MGLINQAQNPPQAPEATSATMPVEAPAEEVEGMVPQPSDDEVTIENDDLTPEEREAYDSAMNMAAEIIYEDDKANSAVMEKMKGSDPPQAIADLTGFIISQIEQAFQGKVPETIIIPLGDEISDLLLELGETNGDFTINDEMYKKVKAFTVQELFEDYGIEEADMETMLQGVTGPEVEEMKSMFGQARNGSP